MPSSQSRLSIFCKHLSISCSLLLLATGVSLTPGEAAAQQPLAVYTNGGNGSTKDWDVRLGLGAQIQPEYEGGDEMKGMPLPLINIKYKDIAWLRGPMLGLNAFTWQGPRETDKLQLGPAIRYQRGRDQDDSDDLRGTGNIDPGAEVGFFITYGIGQWTAGLMMFQDVSSSHDGFTVRPAVGHTAQLGQKWQLRSELYGTYASDDYMETFFGINATQASRSGMRRYQAEASLKDVGLLFDLDYALTKKWALTTRLGLKKMLGDAADSPLVEDRGSDTQGLFGVFVSYKF